MTNLESIGSERLALGTVQFGLPYGISNMCGQTTYKQVELMLDAARASNIETLDTAIAYGQAETVLGQIGVSYFRIISKLPAYQNSMGSIEDFVDVQLEASLARLGVSKLSGLMMHAPDDLLGPHGEKIVRKLQRAKEAGLVERIGLSVYSPDQLSSVYNFMPLEILQIPLNIFDRRFHDSGWLELLAKNGVEIHARSVFLQGLLLLPIEHLPGNFLRFQKVLNNWHSWLADHDKYITPLQACIQHVASYPSINRIVVGAESKDQLLEIISATNKIPSRAPVELASSVSSLINPSKWSSV